MTNIVCETVYFEKPGSINTEETHKLAKERAEELDIKNAWLLQKVRQVLRLPKFSRATL